MGVYEIYSPKLVDVSPNWVIHPPGMGELVHPPAGDTPLPTDVYSPTRRCLLPLPAGVYSPQPVFIPPRAGVYFPHAPVFTSPTRRCLLPPRAGVYFPHAPVFTSPTRWCLLRCPRACPRAGQNTPAQQANFHFRYGSCGTKETLLSVSLGLVDVKLIYTRACRVLGCAKDSVMGPDVPGEQEERVRHTVNPDQGSLLSSQRREQINTNVRVQARAHIRRSKRGG